MRIAKEPSWFGVVRPVGASAEGNGLHLSSLCHLADGFKLPNASWDPIAALPRSSACCQRQTVVFGAVSNTSAHRITWRVPSSAFSFNSTFSHGNPGGNSLDRTGLGPMRFADTALDQVEHGGDMMMMSNSPHLILSANSQERLRRVLRKKAVVIIHLHTLTSADLHLYTFTPADLHLHTLTSADLHLHTLTSADLHLHTFTSADLHLHTLTCADLDLHTFTSADLHLHTLTSADLHLDTFTPADLHLHTFTSADLHLHTLTSADLHLHTLTPADLHLHTLTPADLHLHTFTPADLHLHTFTSSLALLSISLLRWGRCRRCATKRNPFARNGRWTSKTEVKLRF